MTQVPDKHPQISDVALQAPPTWRDPHARPGFGLDGDTLKVLGQEYGDAWPSVVAQAYAGTALLSSGASTVLPAALSADDIHAVTACTFFAQCAANAQVPGRRDSPDEWYAAYLEALTGLGCFRTVTQAQLPMTFHGETFDIDRVVVDLLAALAMPASAGSLATQAFRTLRGLQGQGDQRIRFLDDTSLSQEHFALLYSEAQSVAGALHLATLHLAGSFQERRSSFLGLHFGQVHFEGLAQGALLEFDTQAFSHSAGAIYGRVDGLVREHVASVPLAV